MCACVFVSQAMVSCQMLSELEEVIQYKLVPERRDIIRETWWERLQVTAAHEVWTHRHSRVLKLMQCEADVGKATVTNGKHPLYRHVETHAVFLRV